MANKIIEPFANVVAPTTYCIKRSRSFSLLLQQALRTFKELKPLAFAAKDKGL
ncbi:MAG: hypothetical protein ICV79_15735 [Flavisolibacter sp.]|nr:hypothetical protein [Flavisolibacter sp.]